MANYISVSNNLLDPKHFAAMGQAVWLYLWLLDKVTRIEAGKGQVLGGKPMKQPEMCAAFNITDRTCRRWLTQLEAGGYISTRRTPYGTVICLLKAKKIFGGRPDSDRTEMSDHTTGRLDRSVRSTRTEMSDLPDKNVRNKEDKTVRQDSKTRQLINVEPKFFEEDQRLSNLLYELIKNNNPHYPHKPPNEKWFTDMNRINRLDGIAYPIIEVVIRWCQQDSFWKGNILSVGSLRKQLPRLMIQAKEHIQRNQIMEV